MIMSLLCCYCDVISNFATWLSPLWLKLLSPWEFFVTVDHSALWQKHVAWAKPKGSELMQYITARYSTNMVLLSLLLSAEINVFFNSSRELVELRAALESNNDHSLRTLKVWIGMILLLDICVTLLGLVTTFTLWGMISAISPVNAHCLLRSTIGQYVISLPPRLLVAALYLFWTWILLFILHLVMTPMNWIFVGIIAILFVSIVIPLSIFGRLVLHTGAMSSKPILQSDLEVQLLPSGLQASLWIRASHQQQRNTEVITQYKHQRGSVEHEDRNLDENGDVEANNHHNAQDESSSPREISGRQHFSPKHHNHHHNNNNTQAIRSSMQLPRRRHRRLSSSEIVLPQASILNSTISRKDLLDLLKISHTREDTITDDTIDDRISLTGSHHVIPESTTIAPPPPVVPNMSSITQPPEPPIIQHRHRRGQSSRIVMEWVEDQDVRDLYGAAPAAALPEEEYKRGGFWNFSSAFEGGTANANRENALNEISSDLLTQPLLENAEFTSA